MSSDPAADANPTTPADDTAAGANPADADSIINTEQQAVPDAEEVEKPVKVIKGQQVVFEQNYSAASTWPGGDFRASVPGVNACCGPSYEAALKQLEEYMGAEATDPEA